MKSTLHAKLVTSFIAILMTSLLLACCGQAPAAAPQSKSYIVQPQSLHKVLYFTGVIQPLHESTLTNQMDAVIETMHYHYGQFVKKNDVVFTLNSIELQKQYNEILTDYLKAKDNYTIANAKFTGTEDLWKAGLLAKNNYLSERSSLNTSRVSLMQASQKLSDMLEKMGESDNQALTELSFDEFDNVRLALNRKNNLIRIKAPADGVLLYPPKLADDKSGSLSVGTSIKSGQVLALVGDLSGIHVQIDIPEVDIDKIKNGMKATIHSVAFPKDELKGELVAINAQASASTGGTLPSFSAIIEVTHLTEHQRQWIKVGMSASIELSVDSHDHFLVPIEAVKLQKGQSVVNVKSASGEITPRVVTTGESQADKVIVDSGLKAGELIVYG